MAFCRDRKGENMQEEFLIGEMAELLGVSRDTLRIYEEQGILKPKRDENGFRKYTPEDLGRLIGIRCYRGSYLPMREIRRLFESSSPEVRIQVLEEQLRAVQQYAAEQGLKLSGKLHSYFLNQFEEAGAVRYLIQMFAPLA